MVNDVYAAIGHPIRRQIIERLGAGPATVGEASKDLGVSKPAITRHVRVLEEAGVVTREVSGRQHHLTLEPEALGEPMDWMDRQRALWTRMFDAVERHIERGGDE